MSKDIIPVNKTISTLPDNEGKFTMEEYELFNTTPRYTHLLHVMGGIKQEPENQEPRNYEKSEEVNDELPTQKVDSSFLKAILLVIFVLVTFSCILSVWNTLPPSIQILPGLWFNK